MGDEVPIQAEAGGASSRRVVREPSRWTRAAAVAGLVGLAAGGVVVSLRGGGPGSGDDGSDQRPAVSAGDAYADAIGRLGRARSFAYRGSVQATEPSPMRPGAWLASEVTVEGAVLLPLSLTREVAVAAGGGAVETVTSGPTAWSRTASSAAELADASWEVVTSLDPTSTGSPRPEAFASSRMGMALVPDVLRSAGDRRRDPAGAGADAGGRPWLRATVSRDTDSERYGDLLAGADVALVLDEAGDIAHLAVTSVEGDGPGLAVDLAIERVGEPGLITPADVGDPARRAAPVDLLAATGVEALELARVPPGWALTDAREGRVGSRGHCGADGCRGPLQGCPALGLDYRDLAAVSAGRLSLWVAADSCLDDQGRLPARGEPFRVGAYSGWAEESPRGLLGEVSDGVRTVGFDTDLSTADTAVVLGSLAPFDVATEPEPIAGIPSS